MSPRTVIIIMAKQPVAGQTKTRLIPFLNAEEAACLYEGLLLDTIDLAAGLHPAIDLAVAISPPESRSYFERITPPGTPLYPVAGTNIGICLSKSMSLLFSEGYSKVIALNSDGPSLPASILKQAVKALDTVDLVLGPSDDGGYYLVGIKKLYEGIFESINWSSDQVLRQTLDRAARLKLLVALTKPWYDVDTPEDLLRIHRDLRTIPPGELRYTRLILARLGLEGRT
jgi:uncharacterized protein